MNKSLEAYVVDYRNGDQEAMEKLLGWCLKRARFLVKQRATTNLIPKEDLVGIALTQVFQKISYFSLSMKFSTWSVTIMHREISKAINRQGYYSETIRGKLEKLNKIEAELLVNNRREEISKIPELLLEGPMSEVRFLYEKPQVSLHQLEEHEYEVFNQAPSCESKVVSNEYVSYLFSKLPPKQAQIMTELIINGLEYQEILDKLDMNKSTFFNIRTKAIKNLRTIFKESNYPED